MKVGYIPHTPKVSPYAETTRVASNTRTGFQGADKLELNESKHQFQVLLKAARDVPDVRMDKVLAVQKKIETGAYQVDSRAVAEKILGQL